MKKILICTVAAVLFAVLCVPVFAEADSFPTAWELYLYWEENDAYPAYVTGVWTETGGLDKLTIGVLNTPAGVAGKAEILSLIENDDSVAFGSGAYSKKYLNAVMEQLVPYFESGRGLAWGGVNDMTGRITLGILEDKVSDPDTLAMLEEMRAQFGDVFVIEYTGALVTTLELPFTDKTALALEDKRPYFAIAAILAFLCLLTAVFVRRKRHTVALQTSTGEVLTDAEPLTVRQTEHAVRQAQLQPSAQTEQKIFDAIAKK